MAGLLAEISDPRGLHWDRFPKDLLFSFFSVHKSFLCGIFASDGVCFSLDQVVEF